MNIGTSTMIFSTNDSATNGTTNGRMIIIVGGGYYADSLCEYTYTHPIPELEIEEMPLPEKPVYERVMSIVRYEGKPIDQRGRMEKFTQMRVRR